MEGSNFTFPPPYLAQASASESSAQAPLPTSSSVSAGPSAPVQLTSPASSARRFPEHLMHKNRLQQFAQRSNIPLPIYQIVNEGFQHAPRFRSTVWVDGMSYTSQNTFSQRKAAEQDVAKLALEWIPLKIKDEDCPLVLENTQFYKSILNEYAAKLNLGSVTYNTVWQKGLTSTFVSSLVFNGKRYTGKPGGNRKKAEQSAAGAAIFSILGNSDSGTVLTEIIKSKSKFFAAINNVKDSQYISTSTVSPITTTGHTSVRAAPVAAKTNEMQVTLPECSSRLLPPWQEFQMPKQELSHEGSELPNVSLQAGSEQSIDDSSSVKKRKKNKKKANKKSRIDSLIPISAQPLNEVPPCSVVQ